MREAKKKNPNKVLLPLLAFPSIHTILMKTIWFGTAILSCLAPLLSLCSPAVRVGGAPRFVLEAVIQVFIDTLQLILRVLEHC